jgi:FkbM family methyltransferase
MYLETYEPWLKGWWPQVQAVNNGLAFDIGANAGTWTVDLLSVFKSVISLEPDMRCEPPPGLAYDRRAVWSYTGTATLHSREKALQSSLLPDHAIGEGSKAVHVISQSDVECVTLDDLAEQYGQPDFIKMDIEGGEVEALKGATADCFRHALWLIEVHDTYDAVSQQLVRLGYSEVLAITHPLPNAAKGHEWVLAEPKK